MNRKILTYTVGLFCLAPLVRAQSVYTPIPDGFDFPADQSALLTLRDNQDVTAMRMHAWKVFAGLTQPARPNDPTSEAVWETWYYGDAVFSAQVGAVPQGVQKRKRIFTPLRQTKVQGAAPEAVGKSLASFTLFNQDTRDHIRSNRYQLADTMTALNNGWPNGTAPQDRKIKDFPVKAVSLKTVWWVVKKKQPTGMYIWDEKVEQNPAPAQPPPQWARAVIVDPTREQIPAGETGSIVIRGKTFPNSHLVPLKSFYYFAATADDLLSLNAAPLGNGEDPNLGTVEVGDFVVLAAMHYTTKEIPQWVWATLWWHDQPDDGPYGKDRPDASMLKGPWRNYKMNVAFDMTIPKESDGGQKVIFNPWLEARFTNGVRSNCMACHQKANWPNPEFLPIQRGPMPDNAPLFQTTTKADFVWAIRYEGGQ